jgi:hypothetical protein
MEDIIPHLGLGYRLAHTWRGLGNGITAQIHEFRH